MSCGIYKITNLINNKVYIGCSKDIEHRWTAHKSESKLEYNPPYNYSVHRAFRKYGINNFSFEIIELVSEDKLFDREKYWIQYYNSYNTGYNETQGGDGGPSISGEENPNTCLTEKDIIFIRTAILNGKMQSEIYPLYADKISLRGFSHIWRGDSWKDIIPEAIDYVHSKEYMKKIKQFARQKSISEDKQKVWKEIKSRKEKGEARLKVYEDYSSIYTLSGFNKVWYRK